MKMVSSFSALNIKLKALFEITFIDTKFMFKGVNKVHSQKAAFPIQRR